MTNETILSGSKGHGHLILKIRIILSAFICLEDASAQSPGTNLLSQASYQCANPFLIDRSARGLQTGSRHMFSPALKCFMNHTDNRTNMAKSIENHRGEEAIEPGRRHGWKCSSS